MCMCRADQPQQRDLWQMRWMTVIRLMFQREILEARRHKTQASMCARSWGQADTLNVWPHSRLFLSSFQRCGCAVGGPERPEAVPWRNREVTGFNQPTNTRVTLQILQSTHKHSGQTPNTWISGGKYLKDPPPTSSHWVLRLITFYQHNTHI